MKKTIRGITIALVLGLSPALAFAAITFTAAPIAASSGAENTILFTYHSQSSGAVRFYLYDGTGANVSGNENGDHADGASPIAWTTAGFSTGLTPGSYTVIAIDNDGIVGGNTDPFCGTGQMLSTCAAAINPAFYQERAITITAFVPPFSPAVGAGAVPISTSTQPALLASVTNMFQDPGLDALIVLMIAIDMFFWFTHRTKKIILPAGFDSSYDKEIGILNRAGLQSDLINARATGDLLEIEGRRRRHGKKRRDLIEKGR